MKFACLIPLTALITTSPIHTWAQDQPSDDEDSYAVYGEAGVLQDYRNRDTKLGHIPLGAFGDAMDRYFAFKEKLSTTYGFNYIIEYSPQYQWDFEGDAGTTANDETNLIVQWALVDPQDAKKGNLLAWYQISRTLGSDTTSEFMQDLGVISPVNGGDTGLDNTATRLQHLTWEQWFANERFRVMAGKMTTRVLMNLNRYATSDREDFFTPMLVNNPVVHYTARIGLGLFGQYHQDDWYLSAMIRDASATKDGVDFDSVSDGDWEYLTEFALTPDNLGGFGEGIYRITYSYTDQVGEGAFSQPAGWTVSLSFDQDIGEKYGAAIRYAYADEDFRAFQQRLALGLQIKKPLGFENDRIGFGFWWGEPSNRDLNDEYGLEAFWKIQVARFLELSADVQTIFDPANRPDKDAVFVGGLRFRVVF
ncbi:MAG: carbohydrate porin [Candidatus Competibacteraceae bacterium]|jgi:hypothetical protein|nr:carbohydrate porin [Candidatus Competibacteraceae bacterium]